MNNTRQIHPSDVRLYYFGSKDVLSDQEKIATRKLKLERAMVLTNCEHHSVRITMQLPTGETVETHSDLVDYAENFVVVKGGHVIPVWAIVDVDL